MKALSDTVDLIKTIAAAIASDDDLDAWCQSEFGKSPTVWIDINDQDPPEVSEYPVIAIIGVTGDERGAGLREITRQIQIGCAVNNTAVDIDGSQKIHPGFFQAERLRQLVESAVYRTGLGSIVTNGQSASESRPPVFTSFSVITITTLKTTRRGQPG